MQRKNLLLGSAFITLGLMVVNAPMAAAQEARTDENVIITVPRPVKPEVVKPAIGRSVPLSRISIQRSVSYADLDLSRASDAAEFEYRIKVAAVEACKDLVKQYPPSVFVAEPQGQNCAAQAASDGLAMAHQLIADARR